MPEKDNTYKDGITDHEGRYFISEEEMCNYWKVQKSVYDLRRKIGMSKRQALTFYSLRDFCKDNDAEHIIKQFDEKANAPMTVDVIAPRSYKKYIFIFR